MDSQVTKWRVECASCKWVRHIDPESEDIAKVLGVTGGRYGEYRAHMVAAHTLEKDRGYRIVPPKPRFLVKLTVDLPPIGPSPYGKGRVPEGQTFEAYVGEDGFIRIKTSDGPRLVFRGEVVVLGSWF